MNSYKNSVRPTLPASFRGFIAALQNRFRLLVKGDRLQNLAAALSNELTSFSQKQGRKPYILDYGCGNGEVKDYLITNDLTAGVVPVDIYPKPEKDNSGRWANYIQLIPNTKLDFAENHFDMTLLIDVLHHAGVEKAISLLADISKFSRYILVKDHLEYGFYSRHMLRLADWYGNWAYGVKVPDKYFTVSLWKMILEEAGLREIVFKTPVRIHTGLFGIIIPPKHHFISVLEAKH